MVNFKLKKGFTLVETLVALGLFVLTISAISGVFLMASSAQRKTSISQRVQNDARAVMEAIATDMRMGIPEYSLSYPGATFPIPELRLRDEDDNQIIYRIGDSVACIGVSVPCLIRQIIPSGETIGSVAPITSKGVIVPPGGPTFYIFPADNPFTGGSGTSQPRVTILLTLQSTELPPNQVTISLQTTVSSRVYGQ